MEERKGFGSNFGFLMASVGSAVGLGNIWGFPNKMGASGGFTFLVVYLVLAVLCGFIVMVGELALGRKTGKGVVSAYHVLSKRFKWLGWLGILSPFFILFFYCALGGYCIKYVVVNVGDLFGASFGSNGLDGAGVFGAFMGNQMEARTKPVTTPPISSSLVTKIRMPSEIRPATGMMKNRVISPVRVRAIKELSTRSSASSIRLLINLRILASTHTAATTPITPP